MKTYKVTVGENGTEEWFWNDRRHREGGKPAIECANGDKYWFVYGEQITEAEAIKYTKPKSKKLTMAQLTELLGYEVEIIK